MLADELSHEEKRAVIDLIVDRTRQLYAKGLQTEILTVDNHADGPYIYMKLRENGDEQADQCLELLRMGGGNRSGIAFACIDNEGNVLPDQFMRNHILGNIREKRFEQIWESSDNPILAGLKNRKPLLGGRCVECTWLDVCNGNFRARAEAGTGDLWAPDPACYLTDEECEKSS